MVVTTYCINQRTPNQYYGLKNAEENTVLHSAPNNWKTRAGAERWAVKNGFTIQSEKKLNSVCKKCPNYNNGCGGTFNPVRRKKRWKILNIIRRR